MQCAPTSAAVGLGTCDEAVLAPCSKKLSEYIMHWGGSRPVRGCEMFGCSVKQAREQWRVHCASCDIVSLAACCGFDLCYKYIWNLLFAIFAAVHTLTGPIWWRLFAVPEHQFREYA